MRRRWVSVLAAAALLAISTATLDAQSGFQDAYREGMAAYEQRRWQEAAKQFQRAVQLKAESGENVRLYGVRFEPYLPQFFLGRSLFEMGDLQGAVRAFDTSEQGNAVRKTRYYQTLQEQRRDAQKRILAKGLPETGRGRPAVPDPPPVAPPPEVKPPPAEVKPPPAEVKPAPPEVKPPPPAPSAEALRAADQLIQQAERQRQLLEQTRNLDELRRLENEISRLETRASAELDTARQRLEGGRRGNVQDLSAVSSLAQSAAAGFDRARQMSEDVRKRVMTSLVSASALYFSGNYAAARTELGKLNYAEGFPAVQMRLFRAASAYALFLTGGQVDQKLLEEAAANVRECRRLAAAGFRPDPKAFSPRFVLFFNRTS